MWNKVSIARVKSHFSEYVSKVAYSNERVIITKRDKPIAAIVNIDDLKHLTQNQTEGLKNCLGKWQNFEEIVKDVEIVYKARNTDELRNVSF